MCAKPAVGKKIAALSWLYWLEAALLCFALLERAT